MNKIIGVILCFILVLMVYNTFNDAPVYIVQYIENNELKTLYLNDTEFSDIVIQLDNDSINYWITIY